MNEDKADIVDRLAACCALYDNSAFAEAKDEITRLRAGQFRWIPVGERAPTLADGNHVGSVLFMTHDEGFDVLDYHYFKSYKYWAPIPPLPEQSQEERDNTLLQEWMKRDLASSFAEREKMNTAFLAGLKAARGEKP